MHYGRPQHPQLSQCTAQAASALTVHRIGSRRRAVMLAAAQLEAVVVSVEILEARKCLQSRCRCG